ncbi:MAG: hypothetical protein JOS17DRAFT_788927 [Linnemannia elongata]|nr:MAG: hypothetical protein JOS17DRAFT_788927 [Linnemannia elongata]
MAFMRAGPSFYVQGGKVVRQKNDYAISPQLYALDISISWTTDSPPWTALTAGPTYNLCNGVTSPDNKTLTILVQQQTAQLLINQFSVDTNTWKNSFAEVNENLRGIRPVVDPTSGLIYIQGQQNMIILDPRTVTIQPYPIASTTMPSRSFPGAVYHPGRKSILYLGGFSPVGLFEAKTYVTEYIIATNSWGIFATTGSLPTSRADHCMTINEDGSKIIVFGGRIPYENTTTTTTFTGTLYILDVATATWTEGTASDPRLYMACTIVGDQFIAWGGFDGVNTIDGLPIIYSLTTGNWINTYTAPAYYANRTQSGGSSPSSPPNPSSGQDSSKLGAILGGTLGSICVLAFAVVFYLLHKRRADKAQYKALAQQRILSQIEMSNKPSSLSFDNNPSSSPSPLSRSSAPTTATATIDVSRSTSQYNPITIKPVIRNPQDEGNRNHTIDYDPINYIKVNPHPVFQSNLGGVFYVPQVSSHHYPVMATATQSQGVGPILAQSPYSQPVLVQPVGFDPGYQQLPQQLQQPPRRQQQQQQQQQQRQRTNAE